MFEMKNFQTLFLTEKNFQVEYCVVKVPKCMLYLNKSYRPDITITDLMDEF